VTGAAQENSKQAIGRRNAPAFFCLCEPRLSFMNSVPDLLITAPLLGLLSAAAWNDVKSFRIPNSITVPGVLLGIGLNSILPSGLGFTVAAYGFALGLFGLLPLYLLRIWGAGDVKLMAVVGAFLGPSGFWGSLLISLLIGGVIALLIAGYRRNGKLLLKNLRWMLYQMHFNVQLRTATAIDTPEQSAGKIAYAVPILLGTSAYLASLALA
jgi:prepilin peptidase CpaA